MFGFIGLGNIGRPMARRLAQMQKDVLVYDVNADACAALTDVARVADSLDALGRECSNIAICVRNDEDVSAVLFGNQGVLHGARARERVIVAVHSTIGLRNLVQFAERARDFGVELVDAAVTGGAEAAARGELTAMIGGEAGVLERLRPMVGAYASNLIHAGPLGAGMKLKVANNLVTYGQFAVGVEAMRLAIRSGVGADQLIAVMKSNGNLTPAMDAYFRNRAATGGRPDEFLAFQRGIASLAEKDLDHALESGVACGADLALGRQVRALFRSIVEINDQ